MTKKTSRIIENRQGQSTVEYLLTTMAMVTFFAGMYAFLQGQVKKLFILAGVKILSSYQ